MELSFLNGDHVSLRAGSNLVGREFSAGRLRRYTHSRALKWSTWCSNQSNIIVISGVSHQRSVGSITCLSLLLDFSFSWRTWNKGLRERKSERELSYISYTIKSLCTKLCTLALHNTYFNDGLSFEMEWNPFMTFSVSMFHTRISPSKLPVAR